MPPKLPWTKRPAHRPQLTPDTFLLWEPCSASHGEIVPGYAFLLAEAGYRVAVMLTPARLEEGLFDRFGHANVDLYRLSQKEIRRFLATADLSQAAGLIITTAGKMPQKPDDALDLAAVLGSSRPKQLLVVEHDADPRLINGLGEDKTITLRPLDPELISGTPPAAVNPQFFGAVKPKSHKGPITTFTMVGAARSHRRNQNMVWQAATALLEDGITDFRINLIGKPDSDGVPSALRDHVIELGRLDYPEMYARIEESDFLLTAFQRDNPDHAFYRTTGTSGSFQLSYGFATPIVVQDRFAANTAFTAELALFYDSDDDMRRALQQGIEMTDEAYRQMQQTLTAQAQALHETSLKNLKGLLDD